ncbi:MAG: hypothetical protein H0T54_07485 [Geodermatophilaceae bacterium]|nr:hypothetical protein [Geodermatophilaceae bacterium]
MTVSLREPDSASFGLVDVTQAGLVYTVTGTVSARNGFGGMASQAFRCVVEYREGDGDYYLLDLDV